MSPYQCLKSERGPDFGIFKVRIDHQKNNRNQHVLKAVVLEAADSANVVAITPDQKIILVRQFRFGIGKETLEIPGGMVDKGEVVQTACARELLEETGYASKNWRYLGPVQSNPVYMDSLLHQYIATDVVLVNQELKLDPAEQIDVVCLPREEVRQLILDRTIQHPHTLTALMQYFWEIDRQ